MATITAGTRRTTLTSAALAVVGLGLLVSGAALFGWQLWHESPVWPEAFSRVARYGEEQGYTWNDHIEKTYPLAPFWLGCAFDTSCRRVTADLVSQVRGYWPYWWGVGLAGALFGGVCIRVGLTRKDLPTYAARFLTLSELKRSGHIVQPEEATSRSPHLALGHYSGQLIGVRRRMQGKKIIDLPHGQVIAPTGSGKTTLAVDTLLRYPGSAVVVDVKGELFALTAGYRATLGEVFVIDPTGVGNAYDPISDVGLADLDLSRVADILARHNSEDTRSAPFTRRASAAIKAALLGARQLGVPPLPYLFELVQLGDEGFIHALAALESREQPGPIRRALTTFLGQPPEQVKAEIFGQGKGYLDSAWNTVSSNLDAFASLLPTFSGSDFSARDLGRGKDSEGLARPVTLYLRWPLKYLSGKGAVPLELILSSLITASIADANEQATPERMRRIQTLLMLDELSSYPLRTLPDDLVTMRSAKLTVMMFVQSLSQLENAYGDHAKTIASNCDYKVFMRPREGEAAYLERKLGKVSFMRQGNSRSRSWQKRTETVSDVEVVRPFETASEIEQLPRNQEYLILEGTGNLKCQLLDYNENVLLRSRTALRAPHLTHVVDRPILSSVVEEKGYRGRKQDPETNKETPLSYTDPEDTF